MVNIQPLARAGQRFIERVVGRYAGTRLGRQELEGELIEDRSVVFTVRTAGIERFLESTSRENPWAYGLASVLLALFTGWLGSVAFKR